MYIASSGTLDVWDGNPVWVDALNGNGTVNKNQTGGTAGVPIQFHVGDNGGSGTFSGVIENTNTASSTNLAFYKEGAGLQVLSGNNTYNGPTTISGGTLQIGSGGATGSINNTNAITNNGAGFTTFPAARSPPRQSTAAAGW